MTTYQSFDLFLFWKNVYFVRFRKCTQYSTFFIHYSYVENVTEKRENEGINHQKFLNSNVIVMSHIKYFFVSVISYNEDTEY